MVSLNGFTSGFRPIVFTEHSEKKSVVRSGLPRTAFKQQFVAVLSSIKVNKPQLSKSPIGPTSIKLNII